MVKAVNQSIYTYQYHHYQERKEDESLREMAEMGGKKRSSARQQEDENLDRLSDLPDNLIHQIMSFHDIKTAIQTCVLSKRWDRLWVSLPDLDFDDTHWVSLSGLDFDDGHWDSHSSFGKFVLKVLSARADCNVGKFQISSRFSFDDYLLQKIIDYVVSHNVEHLDLWFLYETRYCFLQPLTMCDSLKTLKLSNFILEDLHESFGFGFKKLTSLNLFCCRFCYTRPSQNCFSSDPFASCPNLKNLCLQHCGFYDSLRFLKISGLQLLNLEIESPEGEFEILAPRLTSFSLKGEFASTGQISVLDLPSVSYAEIYFEEEYWSNREQYCFVDDPDDDDELVMKEGYINFFRGLYNAKVVTLSSTTIKDIDYVLGFIEQQPSPFKRLKSLKLQCKEKSIVIPARVRTYFLGDDPYEETIHVEGGTDAKTIVYVEFQKVQV